MRTRRRVQHALNVVVNHAKEEGQARAVGVAVAQACGCVLRARGLGENRLLRVAAAGGLATDLVTGGEELIHWEAGGEGDERGGGEEDSERNAF